MKKNKPDKGLIIIIFLLLICGSVILSSASVVISQQKEGNFYSLILHQLIYGVAPGLVVFFVCLKINYKFWKKFSLLIFFAALILMVLVFIPGLGYRHAGAQRWIGFGPISIQPSEFLKLSLIIYLSAFLSKKETRRINTLIPFLAIILLSAGLVAFQSDAGTIGVIAIIGIIIYFLSGAKIYQCITVLVCYTLGFFALIKFFPYRMNRFRVFLDSSIDPQGIGYQIKQALLGIGSGGLLGVGFGRSNQKYNFLPESMGDSVFAIFSEEMGFVGGMVLLALFFVFAFKGLKIVKKAPDGFGKLLAAGITGWLIIQVFINIAAITGLIPLTGIPLPFVSYGGSALVSVLAGCGILVNISKYAN